MRRMTRKGEKMGMDQNFTLNKVICLSFYGDQSMMVPNVHTTSSGPDCYVACLLRTKRWSNNVSVLCFEIGVEKGDLNGVGLGCLALYFCILSSDPETGEQF